MKREKIFYITAIAVLAAALVAALVYKRPLDIKTLTGVTEPDDIAITVLLVDEDMDTQQRDLTLSAGDEGFDELLARLEELRFRRPPTNLIRIVLPFLPESSGEAQEWEDGEFQHLFISLSQPGENGERVYGYVEFWVDEWEYRDFDRNLSLPLAVENAKETGQDLCAQIWEIATPVENDP